jgi:hypothetical protein
MNLDEPNPNSSSTVPAGRLAPWEIGELPPPPARGWRSWTQLLGPGVLLAGASIGSGEWLAGPGVTAQYGGTLLWVASISILAQVFCNLEFMRYALYCGEPIAVGFFRTPPGPRFWLVAYLLLDFAVIWPFNAANAAVPLAAALLGHLPGDARLTALPLSEGQLVNALGYVVFLLAFVPLIFGGTIYKMLERIMTFKLVVVLVYLTFVAVFMVSGATAREVFTGFFRVGVVPLRAQTVVAGRHFSLTERVDGFDYTLKGTTGSGGPEMVAFHVVGPDATDNYQSRAKVPDRDREVMDRLLRRAGGLAQRGRFVVEETWDGLTFRVEGSIGHDRTWHAESLAIDDAPPVPFDQVDQVAAPHAHRLRAVVANQGLERVGIVGYLRANGRLPHLDWALISVFVAIAGAGGITNTMFSNYTREKGWGMGGQVGAIPSAIGGRAIPLSHVGKTFPATEASRLRWRGWRRHVLRDQLAIWAVCSFLGMALPCMLSLEFIRNAPVSGDRVAAMTADGMADRYPELAGLVWLVTLAIGFLILAPGQVMSGDIIARRWTDVIWTSSRHVQRLRGHQVKYIYYGILLIYGLWGLLVLTVVADPLRILKVAGFLMNVALGCTAWHVLYVNRTLLPREFGPGWFMQAGLVASGCFFLGTSVVVLLGL